MRRLSIALGFLALFHISVYGADVEPAFSSEELGIAEFWEDMGPVLRDQGVAAYASRYHENFRHWDIEGSGSFSDKESAVKYWSKFHDDGHRITCTFVQPITIDIYNDISVARLLYEQTDVYSDGKTSTGLWRMVAVFKREDDGWQVLDTNMVTIKPTEDDEDGHKMHCPSGDPSRSDL